MNFTPTEEQFAILDAERASRENLAVIALAGTAKTTTLELLVKQSEEKDILCLAFNASIKKEMEGKLPKHVTCLTLNGLGHRAWGSFIRKRIDLDVKKTSNCLSRLIASELDPLLTEEFYSEWYALTIELVDFAKNSGYLPKSIGGYWKPLITREQLLDSFHTKPTDIMLDFLDKILKSSCKDAQQGIIDFGDQILLPCTAPVSYPRYTTTYIDEAQDLSSANHFMLKKLVRNQRLIAVGDPCQAIYAFRGASTNSMYELVEQFDMTQYKLTVNFRSDRAILEHVKWRVPEIKARTNAGEGEVLQNDSWDSFDIDDGDAIICRNNAPLLRTAIYLLKEGRFPEVVGRDITFSIIKNMKKLGKPNIEQAQALVELSKWYKKELVKTRRISYITDLNECMRIFIERSPTLGEAIIELKALSSRRGNIKLMTGHKAKGQEFDCVHFLDSQLLSDEEQDENLRYVICTRARNVLNYIDTEARL